MKILILLFLQAPTTYTVDPYSTASSTNFHSIGDALSASLDGDTVLIKQVQDASGHVGGYSQDPIDDLTGTGTFVGGEEFPLEVPAGVTVKAASSSDLVQIWDSNGTDSSGNPWAVPTALFQFEDGGLHASAPYSRLEDLTLCGGGHGVLIEAEGTDPNDGPERTRVRLQSVVFVRNSIGLSAVATEGGEASVGVFGCKIVDLIPVAPSSWLGAPRAANQSVGLRFNAIETGSSGNTPPRVEAQVNYLTTVGSFSNLTPIGGRQGVADFQAGNFGTDYSRLIEVYAKGSGAFKEHAQGQPGPFSPIPEVELAIHGGQFVGRAGGLVPPTGNPGWDFGILAGAFTVDEGDFWRDFCAGYRISITGTKVRRFRKAGIAQNVSRYARGETDLMGQAIVSDNGFDGEQGDGIHSYATEGYVRTGVSESLITGNRGHGVFLMHDIAILDSAYKAVTGSMITMEGSGIEWNNRHGLMMTTRGGSGFVGGGGWYSGSTSPIHTSPALPKAVPAGQGWVNSSYICNNGFSGSSTVASGVRFETSSGNKDDVVNCRFVNDLIWNNGLNGVSAQLDGGIGKPKFFAPLVHCTIAGNDGGNFWIAEKNRASGTGFAVPTYESGTLHTHLFNTIFQAKNSGSGDFVIGGGTGASPFADDGLVVPVTSIGVAGCRTADFVVQSYSGCTSESASFVNPVWASNSPSNFYLASVGSFLGNTPNYVPAGVSEVGFDHAGSPRAIVATGFNDIGAMIFDPLN